MMLWAEPAGYQCAALPDSDPVRPPEASHRRSSLSDLDWQLGDLYVPTREHIGLIQDPAARAPSPVAQFCHPAQLSAPGPEERWMLAYWAPVWEVPGSWGMHSTAWSQLSRWNRVHTCSRRAAASEEQRPTCLPHPRHHVCRGFVWSSLSSAGRWRCPRQVGRGKSLSTRPLQMAPPPHPVRRTVAMGYQGGCHGLPDRGSGSVRGMAGACGLLSPGPLGWGLSYKEGPGKSRKSTRYATQSLPTSAASALLFSLSRVDSAEIFVA